MKKLLVAALILLTSAAFYGCKSTGPVSFTELENARETAKNNALWNAQKYRATSNMGDWDIVSRGDSTQTAKCPQGDGWATMDLYSPDKTKKMTLKCSTVSVNIGCMTAVDFKTRAYAQEDGKCQGTDKVPYPLPKIGQ